MSDAPRDAADLDGPYDEGLQAERTLAWRRSCLALAVAHAVAIRYLSAALGAGGALIGVIGIVLAGIAWVISNARYRRVHRGLVRENRLVSDAVLPLLLAGAALVTALGAIVLVVVLWRPW